MEYLNWYDVVPVSHAPNSKTNTIFKIISDDGGFYVGEYTMPLEGHKDVHGPSAYLPTIVNFPKREKSYYTITKLKSTHQPSYRTLSLCLGESKVTSALLTSSS